MSTLSIRRLLCAVAVALVAVPSAHGNDATAAPRGAQIGVLTTGHDARVDGVLAGIHEGFSLAGMEPDVLEKTAGDDPSVARATVKEFAFERIDLVFALGADAAELARDALREPSVVFAAVGYPDALGLPGRGNVCGVAGGVPADEIVACVRRVAPSARRIGLAFGEGLEELHIVRLVEARATGDGFETTRLAEESDGDVASAALDAIWLAPGVGDGRVERLARALAGRRVALIGSRRSHLDAGCSVVLRTDPVMQGLLAAALARRIRDGDAPERLGVRAVRRRRMEVSLDAANRLGHELPLPVLAAADLLLPAFGRRR
jgi:putative ABC transport system substrate-binding protein